MLVHAPTTDTAVKTVLPSSPFDVAGIKPGQTFLEVDGHNVITATHKDIVDLLQCAPQTFTVVMNEPGLEETDVSTAL